MSGVGPHKLPTPAAALIWLARHEAGLTQRELAERLGVPATTLSAYERDVRQPTLARLLEVLLAAGFDLRMHLAPHNPADDIPYADESAVAPFRGAVV